MPKEHPIVKLTGSPAETLAQKIAWEQALDGKSHEAICDAIESETGVRPTSAQITRWNNSLRRKAANLLAETAKQVMLEDHASIEGLLMQWMPQAQDDVAALNAVVKLFERRSKMWGYDAPAKQEIQHHIEPPRITMVGVPPPEELNQAKTAGELPAPDDNEG